MVVVSPKNITRWLNIGCSIVLITAIYLMTNYLFYRHYQRIDTTSSRIYSISEKSKQILALLNSPLQIVVFINAEFPALNEVKELLKQFVSTSDKIKVQVINPRKDPARAKLLLAKYNIKTPNQVVFEYQKRTVHLKSKDLAEFDRTYMSMGLPPKMTSFKGEQAFIASILRLVQEKQKTVCFTIGHGERRLDMSEDDGLAKVNSYLQKQNLKVRSFNTIDADKITAKCDLVIIAGPETPLLVREISILRRHITGGGKLMLLLDPLYDPDKKIYLKTGLEEMLFDFGVQFQEDILVDPDSALPYISPETIYVNYYGFHPITQGMEDIPSLFTLARSVEEADEVPNWLEIENILQTSGQGWGETDMNNLENIQLDERDLEGPISFGQAAWSVGDSSGAGDQMRLIAVGDSDFISNLHIDSSGNLDLFLNIINWLLDQRYLIGEGPKRPENVHLVLNEKKMVYIFLLVMVIMPFLSIIAGVAVWWRRRY